MKKQILWLAATSVAAVVACNKTETVQENPGDAISFRPLVSGVTKAATDPQVMSAFADGNQINVWADYKADGSVDSKYFYDTFTYGATPSGHFTPSAGIHFWPAVVDATHPVTFYATYGGVSQTAGGVFAGFTPADAAASQIDLLVAKHITNNANLATDKGAVVLNFRHALSQVNVKVKNSSANLKFTVKAVKIGYVAKAATAFSLAFDNSATTSDVHQGNANAPLTTGANMIAGSSWTVTAPTSATQAYEVALTSGLALEGVQAASALTGVAPWILLPQSMKAFTTTAHTGEGKEYVNKSSAGVMTDTPDLTGSYIALKLIIENWNGSNATGTIIDNAGEGVWCYWPIDEAGNWTPGFKYTYTVDLAGGGYRPTDVDNDGKLDPVLDAIVISPSCTIDVWNEQAGIDINN
ncbi:MAG: fimbrillin family protein [Bacteroidales bacterium]|nr:fimbrillin family protein [Bacteroidales bacterium]